MAYDPAPPPPCGGTSSGPAPGLAVVYTFEVDDEEVTGTLTDYTHRWEESQYGYSDISRTVRYAGRDHEVKVEYRRDDGEMVDYSLSVPTGPQPAHTETVRIDGAQ